MSRLPVRERAFAALALLRCQDRLQAILGAVTESRREDLMVAIRELEGFDRLRLKQELAQVIRQNEPPDLAPGAAKGLQKFVARKVWSEP